MKKLCPECNRLLEMSEFHLRRRARDGHQRLCRECQNAAVTRTRDRMKAREYARTYAKLNHEKLLMQARVRRWWRLAERGGSRRRNLRVIALRLPSVCCASSVLSV